MGNEVVIEVSALDKTGPTKDELKASWTTFEKSFAPIGITATNPINEAFLAQVKASLKTISKQALEIPINADTAPFLEQLDATLGELSGITKADIPVEIANAAEYRASVQELVSQVSQEVKETIIVEADPASLAALKIQTAQAADQAAAAASAATQKETKAQQQLASAQAAANAEPTVKSQQQLAAAEEAAAEAASANAKAQDELAAAQAAAAESAAVLAKSEDVAAAAGRGMGAAMGPMYMLMNVAQIAMMGLFMTGSSTATATQDLSQQIVGLGSSAGQTALSLLGGNQTLQQMAGSLSLAGTSAAAFSQAFSGGSASMQQYHDGLVQARDATAGLTMEYKSNYTATGQFVSGGVQVKQTVKDIAGEVNNGKLALSALPQPVQDAVNKFNNLNGVLPQVSNALQTLKDAEDATRRAAESLGFSMNAGQQAAQNYGLGIQAASKTLADATAGSTYLENATDKASITAGQGVQAWKQLQASVTSAGQAYNAAGVAVANAEHGVTTASQGVAAAVHSEQQAVLAAAASRTAYTTAVWQETQAEQAASAARAAAIQQLITLKLQSDSAAASVDQAHLSLAQATQAAANVGVNSGNAQALADTPVAQINAGNMAQIAAADALIQAQNQVASAQDSSTTAQNALNTARAQGVDNNPQVLSAEHALAQAQAGVKTAADGVTNAVYAQGQSSIATANAEWGLKQAEDGVTQAENARAAAASAVTTATDASSRSTDQNTLTGAQNRQMLENIFNAYRDATGSEQIAAQATQAVGQQMGFTSDKISGVLNSLNGLNGTDTKFSITGTPSLNPQQLTQIGQELGMNFAQIDALLPTTTATRRAKAVGGPADGMVWVGEQGPELVRLAPGSSVMPHANSMLHAAQGYASGGAVGALGANLPLMAQWGALDVAGQMLHAFGGPEVKLPAAGAVDWGAFAGAGPGGRGGGGSLAASSGLASAAQAYASSILSQYGWGQDQMPALIKLWNQESGWNPYAVNPSSGAYGIPQSLGHGHPYNLGDYIGQVNWGEAYVKGRYGSPNAAWAHEVGFNWYGNGGPASGWAGIGDGGPEVVHLPNGSTVMPAANSHSSPTSINVEVGIVFGGNTDSAMASAFMKLVKAGSIQLTANGQRVKVG